LRRLRELDVELSRSVELVAFNDEEGRFGGMFGSQAIAGKITPEVVLGATDTGGVLLADELTRAGVEPLHALRAQRPSNSVHCFVELHIEQGPVLDAQGAHVGAVSAIVGLRRWQARLIGQPNHAGTTPMGMRRDAFRGLAEVALGIDGVIAEHGGPHSVLTIGRVELSPGAANVIPGRAEFTVDIRDVEAEGLERLAHEFRVMVGEVARQRDLMFEFEEVSHIEPVTCAPDIVALVETVTRELGHEAVRLPSGAAHDTQILASLTDVGMIFVPSAAGRSHSAAEWTSWESIEVGANALLNVLYRLARPNGGNFDNHR
jgi:N-carbamoyl-L-amino-acid hydrolase